MKLKVKTVALVLLGLAIQATGANDKEVAGLKVVHVEVVDKTATITIQNVSQTDITSFTISIDAHFPDGHDQISGRIEEYGPLVGKVLRPGETTQEAVPYEAPPSSVDAKAVVAIYADQTADVIDSESFNEVVRERQADADALQFATIAVKPASDDLTPKATAQQRIRQLLDDRHKGKNKADEYWLKSELEVVNQAPQDSEREYLQKHADELQQRAATYAAFAKVRRRP